ncbi:MAG: glycosyltransferase family 9 protein [Candidatus Omnitrophica bacterium]|nr:glycosyltransferase family 9 protein [Candidatus Omnitrophota bacterium]
MENKSKSFLIINPFGIGDVLFSLPLIESLKESFPTSKIFYLCNKRTYPVLDNNPLIDKTFVYERDEFETIKKVSKISWIKKILSFVSEIKKENIDIAIDLSLNSQFGFFSWLSGIGERIGYNYKKRGRFLTKKIKFQGYEEKHVIEYYLELLDLVGAKSRYKKTEIILNKNQKEKAETFLKQQGVGSNELIITIAPCGGASWGRDSYRKHWPKEKFAELADRLIDKNQARIIFAGSGNEREAIEKIEKLMHKSCIKAIDLPLIDFLAILERSTILVANDGGPLHMGVFLGIKTVSIFGPVSDIVYGPYPRDIRKHAVVKKDLPCRPCYKKFRLSECSEQLECLKSIAVDEVFNSVKGLIEY